MHGICFEYPLQEWFDVKIPKTTISKNYIETCLISNEELTIKSSARIVWLGSEPQVKAKGHKVQMIFHNKKESFQISTEKEKGEWLIDVMIKLKPQEKSMTFNQLKADFETDLEDFELFWYSKPIHVLRENGLLVL